MSGRDPMDVIRRSMNPPSSAVRATHIDDTLRQIQRAQSARDQHGEQVAEAAAYQMVSAQSSVEQVAAAIGSFESALSPNEEAMLCVVGGPAGMVIFPQGVQALPPDKLLFIGQDQDGHRVNVVQHVSQLNIMLRAVPVPAGEAPRRTGFHSPTDENGG